MASKNDGGDIVVVVSMMAGVVAVLWYFLTAECWQLLPIALAIYVSAKLIDAALKPKPPGRRPTGRRRGRRKTCTRPR